MRERVIAPGQGVFRCGGFGSKICNASSKAIYVLLECVGVVCVFRYFFLSSRGGKFGNCHGFLCSKFVKVVLRRLDLVHDTICTRFEISNREIMR